MDVDSIQPGRAFAESIRRSILESDVVLAVIGKNWSGRDDKGNRRIDARDDFVRLEIAAALENNKRVIPVLVDGARPPRREELPGDLAPLAAFNAIELTHSRWRYDTERLVEAILEMDDIARMIRSIQKATGYEALEMIRRIGKMAESADSSVRQRGFELLKPLFCQSSVAANRDSALQDRDVRQNLWRCMRALAVKPLQQYFPNGELAGIDLYGLDCRGASLKGVSFDRSFLVESDLSEANLENSSLCDCRIRNVNFTGARLDGADFTDADWFHATGLTAEQLAAVKPDTLRLCPPTVNAMIESLSDDYAYPFSSWSRKIQAELRNTWKRYTEDADYARWRAR